MSEHKSVHKVATLCRVLGVSRSGYYAWSRRGSSRRARQDADLSRRVRTIHAASRGTYGVPRIHAELAAQGIHVAKKRIARLMARAGIRGVCRRRSWRTTRRNDRARPAPDLVQRKFTAARPNQLWVADITYVPTCEGSVYLAVVLDVFSRKVVGWALETTLRTELVLGALEVALARRQPRGVIHHSDQVLRCMPQCTNGCRMICWEGGEVCSVPARPYRDAEQNSRWTAS